MLKFLNQETLKITLMIFASAAVVYWVFLRSGNTPGGVKPAKENVTTEPTAPQKAMTQKTPAKSAGKSWKIPESLKRYSAGDIPEFLKP